MSQLLSHVPPQFPAEGGGRCKIAFVGTAPGDHERLYGAPLVGSEGRLWDQLLRLSGLASAPPPGFQVLPIAARVKRLLEVRTSFLTTHVFDVPLPDGDLKAWCAPAPERKEWAGYELPPISGFGYLRPEHCAHLSRLGGEIEGVKPNLIVPLGGVALWAFTGSSDIGLARGTVQRASFISPGAKLLPTYHPSHVQQDFRLFHVVRGDLIRAQAEAEFPEVRSDKRRLHVRPSCKDLLRWEKRLAAAELIAVDIETAKQQITCIGFAPNPEEAFVIPFVDYEQPSRSYWRTVKEEALAWDVVRNICENDVPKVLQNGLYDCYYLVRQAGIWVRNYREDTRLQHHALFPELPKSLAFMGASYENPPGPWKQMRERVEVKRDD